MNRTFRLKILIVDDNPHMRKLLATVLRALGSIDIVEMEDAEQAWSQLSVIHPDVAFVDWELSGMSGLEFVRRLRNDPKSPDAFLPVIMLTSHTSIERVSNARDAGVNEFLAKPVSAQAIIDRLNALIHHPRPYVRTNKYFGPCRRRRNDPSFRGKDRRGALVETEIE